MHHLLVGRTCILPALIQPLSTRPPLQPFVVATAARGNGGAPGVQLRPGRAEDRGAIWRLVLQEKLTPLGLDPARFTVGGWVRGSRWVS